ncbi:hypothetical protein CHU92_04650 [Flavobacterium cyanobacteriorum]|uniref:Uncharacterized protein n=2 Tax=Flavobacterium cyanobacteriorum TaxID=2022802 RepID=A0A255ZDQ6_9FLAO|nr:hypothetical protein CHU92_04650 [Flavobacterium cyanobacteriorum]
MITFAAMALAQPDRSSGGLVIPRSDKPVTAPDPSPAPSGYVSPFNTDPFKKEIKSTLWVGTEEKPRTVLEEKNNFTTGGSEYASRVAIKPKGESSDAYKGNIDYGIIRTKSPYIILSAYDFGAEDGDRVKVTVNDVVVTYNITLSNYTQAIIINLSEGFNDIRIEALNQGTLGPNTGGFTIYDNAEKKLKNNEWNLATGFYGKFLVIRE